MAKRNFSPAQAAYIAAKAHFEAVSEEYHKLTEKIDYNSDDIDAIVDQEIAASKQVGYDQALDKLIEAEKMLIEWARQELSKHSRYKKHQKELNNLFENYRKYPLIKEKIIDNCMRFNPAL